MILTAKEKTALELLSDGREWLGLEMIEASRSRPWGHRLPRGTIYVYLAQLEESLLITSRLESVEAMVARRKLPRFSNHAKWRCCRLYRITDEGRRALATAQPDPKTREGRRLLMARSYVDS